MNTRKAKINSINNTREPAGTHGYYVKNLPDEEIKDFIKYIDLKTDPMEHQARALYLGMRENRWLFALDMGLGKTKIVIDIITLRKKLGEIKKTFVVCPPIVMDHWGREIEKHSDLNFSLINGDSNTKMHKFCNASTEVVIASSTWLTAFLNKHKHEKKIINRVFDEYDCLIIDEAHLFKNAKSVGFKMVKKFMMKIPYCYLLTGTPFGNNCVSVFSLYYILDYGKTFGRKFDDYIKEWFNSLLIKRRYFKFRLKHEKIIEFSKLFWRKIIRFEEKECKDLPEKTYITYYVSLSLEQAKLYNEVLHNHKEDDRIIDFAYQLMRVTGGCLTSENPKLDALIDIVNEICLDNKRKLIVWCWLVDESKLLFDVLGKKFKDLSIKCVRGGTKDSDKKKILELWHAEKLDVLIANVSSLGVGIDLFEANTCVFYSNNLNLIDRKQAEKRIHRTGQKHKCFIIDIMAHNTIDMLNYAILNRAEKGFGRFVRDDDRKEILDASNIKNMRPS